MEKHLVIFAREPRYGCVKKRLARDIGKSKAFQFYRIQLQTLVKRIAQPPHWKTWVIVTPDRAAPFMQNLFPNQHILPQGGGDLGQRMARFLGDILPPGPAVLVGSDIPAIETAHISRAFTALGHHDAVFGPAPDGGYWMVGLKRFRACPRGFLQNVRWSSEHTLTDSISSLPKSFKIGLLDELEDVDDGVSHRRWAQKLT